MLRESCGIILGMKKMIHFIMTHKKETYLAGVLVTLLYLCVVATVMVCRMSDTNRHLTYIGLKVEDISSNVSDVKYDMERVKSDISDIGSDIGNVKYDVEEIKSDISTLESDVSSIESDVSYIKICQ